MRGWMDLCVISIPGIHSSPQEAEGRRENGNEHTSLILQFVVLFFTRGSQQNHLGRKNTLKHTRSGSRNLECPLAVGARRYEEAPYMILRFLWLRAAVWGTHEFTERDGHINNWKTMIETGKGGCERYSNFAWFTDQLNLSRIGRKHEDVLVQKGRRTPQRTFQSKQRNNTGKAESQGRCVRVGKGRKRVHGMGAAKQKQASKAHGQFMKDFISNSRM